MSCQAQAAPLEDPRGADLEDHWVEDLVARGSCTLLIALLLSSKAEPLPKDPLKYL